MSGKIEFCIREGKSKDPRYKKYVEWFWKITGEDGTETTVSPRYQELNELFVAIFAHEFLNDWMRDRDEDFTKKRIMFRLDKLLENAQTDFHNHWKDPNSIPMIYHRCNYPKDP